MNTKTTNTNSLSHYLVSPPISPSLFINTNTASSLDDDPESTVRDLMTELDQSIFKNVSSALSTYFLDTNNPGHFVSMPHLGCCASLESNQIMRLVEEVLAKGSAHLFSPSNQAEISKFGDLLLHKVSIEPRLLTPLSKVLIVLRIGETDKVVKQPNQICVKAMMPDYPLYVDAQIQVQIRPLGLSSSSPSTTIPTKLPQHHVRSRTISVPSSRGVFSDHNVTDVAVVIESMDLVGFNNKCMIPQAPLFVAHVQLTLPLGGCSL